MALDFRLLAAEYYYRSTFALPIHLICHAIYAFGKGSFELPAILASCCNLDEVYEQVNS